MYRKIYWGLGALILLVGIVGVFYMLQPDPKSEIAYIDIDPTEIEHAVKLQSPRPARDGYKWEKHGDHWHEVIVEEKQKDAQHVPKTDNMPSIPVNVSEVTIDDIVEDVVVTQKQEYDLLVKGYIDQHMSLYPECQDHDVVLKDAQHNAAWTLSQKKYDKIRKLLHIESDQIHEELVFIFEGVDSESFTGDTTYFFEELSNMNVAEKKSLLAKFNLLKQRSEDLGKKTDLLYQHTLKYQGTTHNH